MTPKPKATFFLLGPRGTGKTTWLRENFHQAYWIDLLDERTYLSCLQDPSHFERLLENQPAGSWVVVDEIQRLPQLLNEVHRQIERKKLKFALTGSSARKLRREGVNLLGGRALMRNMHPFLPSELGPGFNLKGILATGALPLVIDSETPEDTLEAYVQLYLKEEIQAEALTRNLPGFARFLPIISLFHAQQISVSSLARDAGVQRPTAQGFLDILADTLLLHRVGPLEGNLRVREKKHPKIYLIDPGIARAMKRSFGPVVAEETGPLFEGYVFTVIRATLDYFRTFDEISYWSPAEAKLTEVDFVLSRGSERWAIEVKATDRPREDHFKGLRAIEGLRGLKRRILVHRGADSLKTRDGIEAVPLQRLEAFLRDS